MRTKKVEELRRIGSKRVERAPDKLISAAKKHGAVALVQDGEVKAVAMSPWDFEALVRRHR